VAPEAAPAPPEDVALSDTPAPEVAPDADAPPVDQDQPAAAAPEATTEIVTEAETPSLAPTTSARPLARPARPTPAPEPEPEPEPETETATAAPEPEPEGAEDPLADALDAALAGATDAPATPAPSPGATGGLGSGLTSGERDAFRIAVQQCWNVDVGGQSANVVVAVRFELTPEGTVLNDRVDLIEATGGDAGAQRTAFDNARRAILRCQRGGFPLPPEKYDQWRQVEAVFNPEGMRLR
jgi:hypothetical protein